MEYDLHIPASNVGGSSRVRALPEVLLHRGEGGEPLPGKLPSATGKRRNFRFILSITMITTAIAGIGGFAEAHHRAFYSFEREGVAKVLATCDPALEDLRSLTGELMFESRGVRTFVDFDAMLGDLPCDPTLGVLATPIPCHASMHKALVERRMACYLEKPPTLNPLELEQMILVERGACQSTNVGFAHVQSQQRRELKSRILEGEFGSLRCVSLLGMAPRPDQYFRRNGWAGRLTLADRLVLDSCVGNALAHSVNSLLHWAGSDSLDARARPTQASAELYRAHSIEGFDTVFAKATLDNGVELRLAATHACLAEEALAIETLEFEQASITILSGRHGQITTSPGAVELFSLSPTPLTSCLGNYLKFLSGDLLRPAQTLEECRGFVELNAMLYVGSTGIHQLPGDLMAPALADGHLGFADFRRSAEELIKTGTLPASQADKLWSCGAGFAVISDIFCLEETVRHFVATQCSETHSLPC
jgi:predicted dehydrogenase